MTPAQTLAEWIIHHGPSRRRGDMTYLKLQKLVFYSYSAAVAYNLDGYIGEIKFAAWRHGPAVDELRRFYYNPKSDYVKAHTRKREVRYSQDLEQLLQAVIDVYGLLSTWEIRDQACLELPWFHAFQCGEQEITRKTLEVWAKRVFASGEVKLPTYCKKIEQYGSADIRNATYPSLIELADTVKKTLAPAKGNNVSFLAQTG
jgi:uncharacterized phage-associated protein